MHRPLSALCLLVASAWALAACTPRPSEKKATNDYQAPVVSVAPPANIRSVCYDDADLNAFRVRMVQQQLVVGVLQCKGSNGKLHLDDEYAAFVKKFNPELGSNATR